VFHERQWSITLHRGAVSSYIIGTVISVVALGVSLFVLVDSRRLDRRDLLLRLHEQLIAPDRQTGRRSLYQLARQPVESWRDDQFDLVNGCTGVLRRHRHVRRPAITAY
jgi:hypothetical protein